MSESQQPHSFSNLPKARISKNWETWLFWLVPIGAAALACWFIYSQILSGGPSLHIYFDNAAGLEPGNSQVRYRGAQIGEVKRVKLTPDHRQVDVVVSLKADAQSVARQGSRFWIVQPQFSIEEIRGLRTIVSGDYITVELGEGRPQTKFMGLAEPPVIEAKQGLRIVLLAEKLGSLRKRAPVFYRGVQVGEIFDCDLEHDSQAIRATIDIQSRYTPLVRVNSKFWRAGGIHVNLSLSGLNIAAQSAEALLTGGAEFATPDASESQAPSGTTFRLYDKPEEAWLAWSPPIRLNEQATGSAMPMTKPSK